ncbi:M23 family metallopeptidase [Mycolicibacterium pyrenivorans]|uniref:M23 family metallopeptidase n=1 Tax=Mycolicibacterium pyrenivorans TaxID=187102 RepID=UPI0021F308D1|nr:M23 family metallopeptidase [Mycolicibacterium pyrenivorans]MCV7151248.1 M23 family metallopeptidase [Mycolicibacterium pyrenivorans]
MQFRPLTATLSLAALLLTAACNTATETTTAGTTAAPPGTATSPPSTPAPSGPSVATPVTARVLAAPIPVPGTDGKVHLAYELALTNTLAQEVTLTSVGVRAGDRTLLSLPGDRLAYWTRIVGNPTPTTILGPAQTAFVWLDVALAPDETVPDQLVHEVGISVPQPMPPLFPATMTESVAPVTVRNREPIVIAPPLAGPNWLDGNSCCDMTPHRMALNPISGEIWAAERFAIDYLQLGPDGRVFTGDKADVSSYPYFGADILAVADGPVVATLDGLPEQVPGTAPTGLPLDQYGGNHIVQDLGDGHYALYAHLKTGTVKVKPGDRLTTGQVIGSLGNSGNTDAPHLHFHVMSTPDPLRADGLPFVFSAFRLDSRLSSTDDDLLAGEPAELEPGFAPRDENNVSPLVYDVMTYADR